ncbi:hypothetical protein QN277_006199 [Acacia crassicarpa]|uniref:Uncharacterized protein n=1 Tax=Acacia crassicarpa TaxID=499986 RepID=A0AAE1IXU1_9FABA|nr:hypothetical protein QN277_006199 [Acacia crassicarpa]
MISFRSGNLTHMKANMPFKMLIANTQVGRNTKALVAVDAISEELAQMIWSPTPDDDPSVAEKEANIEELMEMNQGNPAQVINTVEPSCYVAMSAKQRTTKIFGSQISAIHTSTFHNGPTLPPARHMT